VTQKDLGQCEHIINSGGVSEQIPRYSINEREVEEQSQERKLLNVLFTVCCSDRF
jgi:hypothetical protein